MTLIAVLVFAVAFLVLAVFMTVVAFHVTRFRYIGDSSPFIFGTIIAIFLLTGLLTFILFDYSAGSSTNNRVTNRQLL